MFEFLTIGEISEDTCFTALGFSPALFGHIETGLLFGFLALFINIVFRTVELQLKYDVKGKVIAKFSRRQNRDGSASE